MKKETQCIHSGNYRDEGSRGLNTPIFTSSSFEYLDRPAIPYPRYFNTPNQDAVVRKMCALEGAADGVIFSSGMAAMSTAILAVAGSGDHLVMMDELYGGTHNFATDDFQRLGLQCSFAPTHAEALIAAVLPETKAIVIESPTNPLLSIIDIRKVADFARHRGITTIIDNTFATPMTQNPIALGVDIVVHSGTKYMGGHSDLCSGIALAATGKTAAAIRKLACHLGGSLDANACYLLERSLKTLALRVERQCQNAQRIAEHLAAHTAVRTVNYPGLPGFKGHATALKQMQPFGAMLSFELDEKVVTSHRFLRRLQLIRPAVSLGGVETIICAPAETSHGKMTPAERARVGISDALLRLSVGIEHVTDLIADLDQAIG